MTIKVTFLKNPRSESDTAILCVYEEAALEGAAKALDEKADGFITDALESNKKFTGKHGQTLAINLPKDTGFKRAVLLGLGKKDEFDNQQAEKAGGKLVPALKKAGAEHITLLTDEKPELSAHLAYGIALRSYRFDKYKSKKPDEEEEASNLAALDVSSDAHADIEQHYKELDHILQGVFLARDLVNEPPNAIYPESFTALIREELKPLGVEIDVIDEKKMEKLGMGAILAVGKGSERQPRMVIMRWKGDKAKSAPSLALVGKGVTFDTGGISLKPGKDMDLMKMDMGGSAAVVGTMKTLALRKSPAHVIGIVGLAENMPSHNAYRPADILTSLSGKTIEVLNTDAEGRLVLADCLTYVQKTYKPEVILDLATLTGAMMVALGFDYAGTFANDDNLWAGLESASKTSGENLWRMPLDKQWHKEIESPVADIKNLATIGSYAGACTAAAFLETFIEEGTPWAHLDIAGTAWLRGDRPVVPKGGSGFGVRVLSQFVKDTCE